MPFLVAPNFQPSYPQIYPKTIPKMEQDELPLNADSLDPITSLSRVISLDDKSFLLVISQLRFYPESLSL